MVTVVFFGVLVDSLGLIMVFQLVGAVAVMGGIFALGQVRLMRQPATEALGTDPRLGEAGA
jgi:hypothetical protein